MRSRRGHEIARVLARFRDFSWPVSIRGALGRRLDMKTSTTPLRTGRVTASGLDYYYEIHGHGDPLVLLHGGLGSIEMFGPTLPALAASHEVIAIDLRGHGRTPLGD